MQNQPIQPLWTLHAFNGPAPNFSVKMTVNIYDALDAVIKAREYGYENVKLVSYKREKE